MVLNCAVDNFLRSIGATAPDVGDIYEDAARLYRKELTASLGGEKDKATLCFENPEHVTYHIHALESAIKAMTTTEANQTSFVYQKLNHADILNSARSKGVKLLSELRWIVPSGRLTVLSYPSEDLASVWGEAAFEDLGFMSDRTCTAENLLWDSTPSHKDNLTRLVGSLYFALLKEEAKQRPHVLGSGREVATLFIDLFSYETQWVISAATKRLADYTISYPDPLIRPDLVQKKGSTQAAMEWRLHDHLSKIGPMVNAPPESSVHSKSRRKPLGSLRLTIKRNSLHVSAMK